MIKKYQSKVLQLYENIRNNEENLLKARRAEIEKKIPEIINIEQSIAETGLKLSMEVLKGAANIDSIINSLKEKVTDLRIRKSELLVSHGYPMDYLDLHYKCSKCKDTGFIGSEKCSCFKNKLIEIYYNNSDLKKMLKDKNFSNFDLELFSSAKKASEPKSPRKNIEDTTNICWNFIEHFNESEENILFFGGPGTGKTFLSNCIAKELLDRGIFVVYRTSEELISDLRTIRFENDSDLEELLLKCDLLIIDDLGSEQISEFSKTELFNLINRKLLKGNKMLISTNCGLDALSAMYSERIASRLLGDFKLCKFYGEDLRISRKYKK
ncbi:MAG: ATP-binding protein [Solirubrobacterales bacterium]